MTHYGLICPASTGHLNTMLPLGKELQQRGHQVTFIGGLDVKSKILAAGLEFKAIGESDYRAGAAAESLAQLVISLGGSAKPESLPKLAGTPLHTLTFVSQGKCTHPYLDEKLLRSILGNFLSNAIKYSPSCTSYLGQGTTVTIILPINGALSSGIQAHG